MIIWTWSIQAIEGGSLIWMYNASCHGNWVSVFTTVHLQNDICLKQCVHVLMTFYNLHNSWIIELFSIANSLFYHGIDAMLATQFKAVVFELYLFSCTLSPPLM